jgi:uncharacterized protein (TIGR03086 family)
LSVGTHREYVRRTMPDTIALLARALDQAGAVIAAVSGDQTRLPTPCAGWDVQGLLAHVVRDDLRNFLMAARGETPDWQAPPQDLGAGWVEDFRDDARELLEQWRAADLDGLVAMPGGAEMPLRGRADQQIAELAVHAWDLVQATGVDITLDPVLAEHALAWSRPMLLPQYRGPDKAFATEVPVPDDAPAYDRMAGWFGRDPHWTRPTGS